MEDTLKALASIFIFFVGWLGVWSVAAIPLSKKWGWQPFTPTPAAQKLRLLLPLYVIAPIAIAVANHLLNQSWRDQGLRLTATSAINVFMGWGIAIAGLCLLLWLKTSLGLITFLPNAEESPPSSFSQQILTILSLLVIGIGIGGIEEVIFRGWLQTQLELAWWPMGAAIAGSLVFALAHLVWDGRPGLWQQPGLWLLGLVLVVARWVDGGSIALAWGLHAGWVSGLAYMGEFLRPQPVAHKPTWLTGRAAQPLTDVLDLALLVITAIVIWGGSGFLPGIWGT